VIFLNTHMDLFILKTDGEKFTSTNKKSLHLIFNECGALAGFVCHECEPTMGSGAEPPVGVQSHQ